MISSARRARPVRRPPGGSGLPMARRVSLPVVSEPVRREVESGGGVGWRVPASAANPFSAYKILNHFDRLRRLAEGELVFPITVEVDPTNVCNHRCSWCVSERSHTGESLTMGRFRGLMRELRGSDVRSVVLKGGGEPTVHPQFVEMLGAAREEGLSVGLITNGSMPRAGSRERILETCEWVRVSIDAATAQTHRQLHGTSDFARVLQNVAYLTGNTRGTMVGLSFVADGRNFHEMSRFAQLARSLGAAYVTMRCVFDPLRPLSVDLRDAMREEAALAKQEEREGFQVFLGNFTDRYLEASSADPFPYSRCRGPNLVGVVGGDGGVYACCFLRGNAEFSFGNINERSFGEIWTGERRREVMEAVYAGRCSRVCAGGLTASRYNQYNELLDYLCAERKVHTDFA